MNLMLCFLDKYYLTYREGVDDTYKHSYSSKLRGGAKRYSFTSLQPQGIQKTPYSKYKLNALKH